MTKYGTISQIIIGIGIGLLLIGGFLMYPYLNSRRAAPSSPTPVASPHRRLSTETPDPPTERPERTAPPAPTRTQTPTPTSTPIPAIPDQLVIPAIGLDAPIVPVSQTTVLVGEQDYMTWAIPDVYAAGWHNTSASLSVRGNTVLNGHNTTNGEVFRDLYKLEPGDDITVYAGDQAFDYTVRETLILPEAGQPLATRLENARYVYPTGDERLTLVTCHPYGSLRNRLIVIAQPVY